MEVEGIRAGDLLLLLICSGHRANVSRETGADASPSRQVPWRHTENGTRRRTEFLNLGT